MSEMIERVARAIALASLDDETRAVVNPETWPVDESYCDMARAAIEAMREPDPDGMYIGISAWNAMIDAALSEKP